MQLTYNNQSPLATGCYEAEDPGITRMGKQVVNEMNRVGMVIDLSHAGHQTAMDVVDYFRTPHRCFPCQSA